MAKIIEVVLELNGKELHLSYKDAQEIYNALKHLFETRVITVPQPQAPNNPYGPPVYYSNKTTAVD
jgi:hypothetical protein